MTIQEHEQLRAAWEAIAAGYDEFVTGSHMELGEEALRRAGLTPAMRFLDVASGSGALSVPAARLGARVLSVDIAPSMIERLTARARDEGLSDLEGRVMDGHALELADATFDVAGSQFGVMLFPDLPRGVSELARVTKAGGRVLIVAFGPPSTVEFFAFFLAAMQAAVPHFTGPPMDPLPLPFQLADPDTFRRALAAAALTDLRMETVTAHVEFRSGQHMWDWITSSNPIGAALVADLTAEQGATVRTELDGMLRERSSGNGPAVLNHQVHIGIGTK
jgi:ubiquinone/menaquinone biosynthesis C-methylase UbiE